MDEELKAHLEAMEGRVMERITSLQEQMLERFRAANQQFNAIGETLKTMNTSLELITSLLTDFARRITDLEKKP